MHKLAVKDWYAKGHSSWDVSEEFTNSLFMPDAWSHKTRPVSTPSSSQTQPATVGAVLPVVAPAIYPLSSPGLTAGPLPNAISQAGGFPRLQFPNMTTYGPYNNLRGAPATVSSVSAPLLRPFVADALKMLPGMGKS